MTGPDSLSSAVLRARPGADALMLRQYGLRAVHTPACYAAPDVLVKTGEYVRAHAADKPAYRPVRTRHCQIDLERRKRVLEMNLEINADRAADLQKRILVGMCKGTEAGLTEMEGTAKALCPADMSRLRESITHEAALAAPEEVNGAVGTNVAYGLYVEMGAGPVEGNTAVAGKVAAHKDYRDGGRRIRESQIGRDTAEACRSFHIDTEQDQVYFAHGQPAQPFLYPALHTHQNRLARRVGEAIQNALKGGDI